jgi:hypothetical protein
MFDSYAELGIYPAAKEADNGQPKINVIGTHVGKTVFSGRVSCTSSKSGEMIDNLA